MVLQKSYLTRIKKNLHSYHTKRGEVIGMSNNALHHAKRAIFALHRDNKKEAVEKIKMVEKILLGINKKYKSTPKILNEGSYKAALEEYVEAKCFFDFLETGRIGEIKNLPIPEEVYLAGLCDVPGELYRYAIKSATAKDIETTKKCAEMAQEIIGELIEFNLTSYLRTKFDQAKGAVQKLQIIVYELSLRK
jgi:predicted translin family RNA/ssDNA-binding protein